MKSWAIWSGGGCSFTSIPANCTRFPWAGYPTTWSAACCQATTACSTSTSRWRRPERSAPPAPSDDQIRKAIASALADYQKKTGDAEYKPEGCAELFAQTAAHSDALGYIEALAGLLKQIRLLGLTEAEFVKSRRRVGELREARRCGGVVASRHRGLRRFRPGQGTLTGAAAQGRAGQLAPHNRARPVRFDWVRSRNIRRPCKPPTRAAALAVWDIMAEHCLGSL